jgi:hypothetical protein
MSELLNLVDGNAIDVGQFPTFTSSRTRVSPMDNDLENFVGKRLPHPSHQQLLSETSGSPDANRRVGPISISIQNQKSMCPDLILVSLNSYRGSRLSE